ncbi:MAG TPA: UDP-N-acetylglucosamine 1-carboxyvinyltransferase [Acidimicrobiales bacterium]|nr:UDP-N-acetylglucosamine 1-carboxyvinyltransferase [Acidimicrobiales bacterium]
MEPTAGGDATNPDVDVEVSSALGRAVRGGSFVVRASGPLHGTVRAGGAKNSVLKLMAATLLAEGRHVLTNVPEILDVEIMADMLRALGASVTRDPGGRLLVDSPAASELVPEAPYELVDRMRASIVVLGPLLTRCGRAKVAMPGGDDFGGRPIDFHLGGLGNMGARFETLHGDVEGTVDADGHGGRLVGTQVVLEYPSHTATDNILMAAVLAKGTTVIENAAREPEVCDLAAFLASMGARIRGAGTSHVEIEGVDELTPSTHRVIPDRVVAATYLASAGLCGGEVVVEDARIDHMTMLVRKLGAMGVTVEQRPTGVAATGEGRLRSVDVATLPYPGVATDYKPFLVTMLTVADGVSIVTENLFAGRFRYIDELRRLGADVRTEGHHAVVRGVPRLSGARVRATDIRAGAALVLAGLVADGETVVTDAQHVDRGYEDLAGALAALGARVERR